MPGGSGPLVQASRSLPLGRTEAIHQHWDSACLNVPIFCESLSCRGSSAIAAPSLVRSAYAGRHARDAI